MDHSRRHRCVGTYGGPRIPASLRLSLNWAHFRVWRRWTLTWLAFVGATLVLGAHLNPRLDEVMFVLFLPLIVLVPYIAVCLFAVLYKAWLWPIWSHGFLFGRLGALQRLHKGRRGADDRSRGSITRL